MTGPGYEDGSGIAAVRDEMARTLAWIEARTAMEEE
jgi:hypothetical protein